MMRLASVWLAPALALGVWTPAAAEAHGPCGCLNPKLVQPGGQVRLTDSAGRQARGVGQPAYRVIFNPRPSDYGIAPMSLASAFRADAPTTTVIARPRHRPTRKGRFRVPKETPPGLYMVLIWDGGEGGAHNTWHYLHVTDRDDPDTRGVVAQREEPPQRRDGDRPPLPAPGGSDASTPWPLILGIGLGGLTLGVTGSRAAARRRA
jgi:hypothetical protein